MKFIVTDIEEGTFNSGNPITADKLLEFDNPPESTTTYDNYVSWSLSTITNILEPLVYNEIFSGTKINIVPTDSIKAVAAFDAPDTIWLEFFQIPKKIFKVILANSTLTNFKEHYWYNCPDNNTTLTLNCTNAEAGDEIEGSNTSTTPLTITSINGGVAVIPTGYTNKIEVGGVFGVKFITATQYVLFGTLIPV